jgi:hypothetical protein
MRQAIGRTPQAVEREHGGTGFVIGAVICAALVVAIFAVHGGPDLLGGRFDMTAAASGLSPD